MRFVVAFTVLGLFLVFSSVCLASDEWLFEATQPNWTFDSVFLGRTTVATYNSDAVGVAAVSATCDSNCVRTDYGFQQRNAAFEAGLRLDLDYNAVRGTSLFGDTLRATLRATKEPRDLDDVSYAVVVAATFECIMVNAAQSPSIRFVSLRVEGEGISKQYEAVVRTAGYRRGPTKRDFR